MAGTGPAGGQGAPGGDGNHGRSQDPGPFHGWAMVWTLFGRLCGRYGPEPDPLCLPADPHHRFLFWRSERQAAGPLDGPRPLLPGGLAFTNSILGVMAALTGGLMGAMLQNPLVLVAVAGILVFFAASLFGFWELRLPRGLTQAATKSYAGLFRQPVHGSDPGRGGGALHRAVCSWVCSPGWPAWDRPGWGSLVFFTLSLGLGLPLFFLAMFSGSLEKLPRSGEWMLWVRKLMGWVLVGWPPILSGRCCRNPWGVIGLGLVALAAGVHLGCWTGLPPVSGLCVAQTGALVCRSMVALLLIGSWACAVRAYPGSLFG